LLAFRFIFLRVFGVDPVQPITPKAAIGVEQMPVVVEWARRDASVALLGLRGRFLIVKMPLPLEWVLLQFWKKKPQIVNSLGSILLELCRV